MIAEPHADAVGGQIEQARHLLAGDVPARRSVGLDELGTRGDETAQLLVDDLGEALGDVHDALVDLARVDPRAEGERAGAGRLRVPGRVCLEVLELFDDAEPAWRRLDAADRLVAGLLVVPPGARLATVGDGLDALDDGVVRVQLARTAPSSRRGAGVDPGSPRVAYGR